MTFADRILGPVNARKNACRSCWTNTRRKGRDWCTPCETAFDEECRAYVNHFYPGTYR